jgi:rhodanese-related sulfurtransferase
VLSLWLALRNLAAERLPEIEQLRRNATSDGAAELPRNELARLLKRGDAVLVDVRPAVEFAHGRARGAINIPIEELADRLDELPQDKQIVAYCRGEYCLFADDAVALLREHGFDAIRLAGGWPEWSSEGRPVERT